MSWEVIIHQEVEKWLSQISPDDYLRVLAALDAISEIGPALGRPFVDTLKGSRLRNLKELRPRGKTLRLIFIFDPSRKAVILTAGDKRNQWQQWYKKNIPIAESRYFEYLAEVE
jgi:hypothetical protein